MYDVVIIGAGPSGLIAANLCGIYGLKTLLVERNSGISEIPKAILVDDETLRVVNKIGLINEVQQVITPGGGADYFSDKMKPFASVRPTEKAFGYHPRNKIVQPIFENVLLEGIKRFSNIEICYSTELVNFEQTQNVKFTVLDKKTQEHKNFEASYMLGCDGGRSMVRKKLGIKLQEVGKKKNGSSFEEPWVIVDLKNDDIDTRHTSFYCNPPRPSMNAYTAFGQRRYEFMLLEGEDPEEMLKDENVAKLIQPFTTYKPENVVKKSVVVFNALVAEKFSDNRVILVGDSAHLTPPFAGQGLNSGVRDAFNIIWKIQLIVTGKADHTILESYEKERKKHVEAMIRLSVRMGSFILTSSPKRKAIRDLTFGALNVIPPLKRYVTEMRFKPKPICTSGLFINIQKPLVGEMIKQGVLLNDKSHAVALDDYLGAGFNLLKISSPHDLSFPALDEATWSSLDLKKISIYPENFIARKTDGDIALTDANNSFKDFQNKFILIRPDFYVMGIFSLEEYETFTEQLNQILTKRSLVEPNSQLAH